MKVIAKVDHDVYMCQISHTEIEKFLNTYYGHTKKLEVGDTLDLGAGYNFRAEIVDAHAKTRAFIEANKDIVKAIIDGISIGFNEEKP